MIKIKVTLVLLVILSSFSLSQQVVWKIYTKQEADNLYGPVLFSVPIQSSILSGLLPATSNYIMFRINNGSVNIVDNNRNLLYPVSVSVNPTDVFRKFSVSLVAKILQDGNTPTTYIESRNNGVLSINNGVYILEYGDPCPPLCN